MKQRKEIIGKIIISWKKYVTESRLVREIRKFPDSHGHAIGDLVMTYIMKLVQFCIVLQGSWKEIG